MKVQMLRGITGFRNGEPWPPIGGVLDVPDHEGDDLITAHHAALYVEPVDVDEPEEETDGLDKLSHNELKALADAAGIAKHGGKAAIAERLRAASGPAPDDDAAAPSATTDTGPVEDGSTPGPSTDGQPEPVAG